MKAVKVLAAMLLVVAIGAIVADNVYLHAQLERRASDASLGKDLEKLKSQVFTLGAQSTKLEVALNGFEGWLKPKVLTLESQSAKLETALNGLESWSKPKILSLEAQSAKLESDLNGLERWSMASDKSILSAVNKLEDWVSTSSVQGKWHAYKRQLGDFESRVRELYGQMKGSIRQKYHTWKNDGSAVEKGGAVQTSSDAPAVEKH